MIPKILLIVSIPFLMAAASVSPSLQKSHEVADKAISVSVLSPEMIQDRLMETLQGKSGSNRYEVESVHFPYQVPGHAKLEIITPDPPCGRVTFRVIWQEKALKRTVLGSAKIAAYAHVAVAKARIRHGDRIGTHNVLMEERDISTLVQKGYFSDWDEIEKLSAKGMMRPGSVLSDFNTAEAPVVVRGQMVDLIYRESYLKVRARVQVLQDGKRGSWIRVENPTSKRKILAKVINEREVRIR